MASHTSQDFCSIEMAGDGIPKCVIGFLVESREFLVAFSFQFTAAESASGDFTKYCHCCQSKAGVISYLADTHNLVPRSHLILVELLRINISLGIIPGFYKKSSSNGCFLFC